MIKFDPNDFFPGHCAESQMHKLLRRASKVAPPGCHCQTRCMAPVVMGRQTPCRDPGRFANSGGENA